MSTTFNTTWKIRLKKKSRSVVSRSVECDLFWNTTNRRISVTRIEFRVVSFCKDVRTLVMIEPPRPLWATTFSYSTGEKKTRISVTYICTQKRTYVGRGTRGPRYVLGCLSCKNMSLLTLLERSTQKHNVRVEVVGSNRTTNIFLFCFYF